MRHGDDQEITRITAIESQISMSLKVDPVFFYSSLLFKVVGILYVQQFFEQHIMPEGEG